MVWTPPQNRRQLSAKDDLSMDTARQEEKRKTATIMEEPSDFMRSRNMEEDMAEDRRLAFGSGWTTLGCIDNIYICFSELDLYL